MSKMFSYDPDINWNQRYNIWIFRLLSVSGQRRGTLLTFYLIKCNSYATQVKKKCVTIRCHQQATENKYVHYGTLLWCRWWNKADVQFKTQQLCSLNWTELYLQHKQIASKSTVFCTEFGSDWKTDLYIFQRHHYKWYMKSEEREAVPHTVLHV